jgi:hypothetical protein
MSRSYTSAKRDHNAEKPRFMHDGTEFQCHGELTALDISELAEVAELGVDTDDPRGAAALARFFRVALGDREYTRFKNHLRAYILEDDTLISIMSGIMEDFAGRPTGQPSSSHGGPSTTGPGWNPAPRHISLGTGVVKIRPTPTAGASAAVQAAGSSAFQPGSSSTPSSHSA